MGAVAGIVWAAGEATRTLGWERRGDARPPTWLRLVLAAMLGAVLAGRAETAHGAAILALSGLGAAKLAQLAALAAIEALRAVR